MKNETTKRDELMMEFQPLGELDNIKLSAAVITRYVSKPTKSGKLPTERDIMQFMMLCRARRLNPFVGDACLVGYDTRNGPEFSTISSFAALLKRAESSSQWNGVKSGLIITRKDGEIEDVPGQFLPPGARILGAWATVYRKDREFPHEARINLEPYRKDNEFWKNEPLMLTKTAKAQAFREAFPLETSGLYVEEEQEVMRDVTPRGEELPAPVSSPMLEGLEMVTHPTEPGAPGTLTVASTRTREEIQAAPKKDIRECLVAEPLSLDETIKARAIELKMPVDVLIAEAVEAGILAAKKPLELLTEAEKEALAEV